MPIDTPLNDLVRNAEARKAMGKVLPVTENWAAVLQKVPVDLPPRTRNTIMTVMMGDLRHLSIYDLAVTVRNLFCTIIDDELLMIDHPMKAEHQRRDNELLKT